MSDIFIINSCIIIYYHRTTDAYSKVIYIYIYLYTRHNIMRRSKFYSFWWSSAVQELRMYMDGWVENRFIIHKTRDLWSLYKCVGVRGSWHYRRWTCYCLSVRPARYLYTHYTQVGAHKTVIWIKSPASMSRVRLKSW